MLNNHVMFGVTGNLTKSERSDGLLCTQVFKAKRLKGNDSFTVEVRFDDTCRNGRMDFAITGTLRRGYSFESGGCCHDLVAEWFPELAHLIKWHLFATDGPMHYIANTIYHADEHGPTHAWVYYLGKRASDPLGIGDDSVKERLLGYVKASIAKKAEGVEGYTVKWDEKTAKTRNLEHARSCAIWPDATDEQLTAPRAELEAALRARLPALLAEFKATMLAAGFEWREIAK